MEPSDLFYLIIFLSVIGSVACILLIFAEKVARLRLPFMVCVLMMFFYAVPLTVPDAALLFHEPMRMEAFRIAALVWVIGLCVSAAAMIARLLIAHWTVGKYAVCSTGRILAAYDECLAKVNLSRKPPLLFGKVKEPACVITTWRSYVILHEEIARELTDGELKAVLTHELLHIKRKHTALQRVFDFICCVHWFNPIVWIGRHEFSSACEIDCDNSVMKAFDGELQAVSYAKVMVRLMELAAMRKKSIQGGLGALDFWVAKHRISNLLITPSKLRKIIAITVCAVVALCTAWLSVNLSRSYFYPYDGLINDVEWSETR